MTTLFLLFKQNNFDDKINLNGYKALVVGK